MSEFYVIRKGDQERQISEYAWKLLGKPDKNGSKQGWFIVKELLGKTPSGEGIVAAPGVAVPTQDPEKAYIPDEVKRLKTKDAAKTEDPPATEDDGDEDPNAGAEPAKAAAPTAANPILDAMKKDLERLEGLPTGDMTPQKKGAHNKKISALKEKINKFGT